MTDARLHVVARAEESAMVLPFAGDSTMESDLATGSSEFLRVPSQRPAARMGLGYRGPDRSHPQGQRVTRPKSPRSVAVSVPLRPFRR